MGAEAKPIARYERRLTGLNVGVLLIMGREAPDVAVGSDAIGHLSAPRLESTVCSWHDKY
jgi:hypothetical protein